MNKHIEKSKFVNKLPKDDPECQYVNSMMEMTTELLRDICSKGGENFDKMHGVVPKCKLPPGYDYGKMQYISIYDQRDNRMVNANSQNSSNSNSTLRMEVDDLNSTDEKKNTAIETVSNDIRLSSDEEEDHEHEGNQMDVNYNLTTNVKKDSEKIFETLNKCSSKIPKVNSLSIFKKHYGNSKSDDNVIESNQNGKKDPPDDASCTGDTEPFEDSNESAKAKPQDVMKFIELLSSSKPEIKLSTFEPIYNEINRKRQAMRTKKDEIVPVKKAKFSVEIVEDSMDLSIRIIPDLAKEFNIKSAVEAMKKRELLKDSKSCASAIKPIYNAQESYSFTKSECPIKKESKINEKCSVNSNTQQLFADTPSGNDPNATKKPQAAAKQIFPHSNYSYSTNVAVVKGNPNKASSSLHNSNTNTTMTLHNQQDIFQSTQQKSKQPVTKEAIQRIMNADEHEADELKVVEGLKAIEKLRLNIKTDFMRRMWDLNTEKWLREADGHKEVANKAKGRLNYLPLIILAVRKYLIYNYSLDVKEQSKKCHEAYIKNAEFVGQINKNLKSVYKDHIDQITDPNSPRLWNLKLLKWFTMTMCLKLSAILQYRAFRNVSMACKNTHSWLRGNGILDKDGHTNTLVTENNQSSPFAGLLGYSPGRNSTRNSSPRGNTPVNQRINVNTPGVNSTLTLEMKAKLQFYIEHTGIINNSYNDWLGAEMNHAKFCEKSPRHEEAWREIEWKIIEKTGGITLSGIDESMAFVIKYLDGFICYMNEFQKNLYPSDSRMIS